MRAQQELEGMYFISYDGGSIPIKWGRIEGYVSHGWLLIKHYTKAGRPTTGYAVVDCQAPLTERWILYRERGDLTEAMSSHIGKER